MSRYGPSGGGNSRSSGYDRDRDRDDYRDRYNRDDDYHRSGSSGGRRDDYYRSSSSGRDSRRDDRVRDTYDDRVRDTYDDRVRGSYDDRRERDRDRDRDSYYSSSSRRGRDDYHRSSSGGGGGGGRDDDYYERSDRNNDNNRRNYRDNDNYRRNDRDNDNYRRNDRDSDNYRSNDRDRYGSGRSSSDRGEDRRFGDRDRDSGRDNQYSGDRRNFNDRSGGGRDDDRGGRFGRGGRGEGGDRGGRFGRGDRGGRFDRGGRGRGGRGFNNMPNPTEGLSNVIPAIVTPHFRFYTYGVDAVDKDGKAIDSRRRKGELLHLGLFDGQEGLLARNGMSSKEIEDLKRIVFFEGSFFFSARQIPFIQESFPFGLVGSSSKASNNDDKLPIDEEGDCMLITRMQVYSAPEEIAPKVDNSQIDDRITVAVDKRCAGCSSAFPTIDALMSHCASTGHDPVRGDDDATPSTPNNFVSFCNVALQRAMGERMARWGKEYIDPKSWTEPSDRQGRSLGVRIFRAYSCEFGITEYENKNCLALTVDLRAKVIRTRSLLNTLCNDQDPDNYRFDRQTINAARDKYISQVVICTYDKRCYSVIDLDFDNSPNSLPVQGMNMSHAEYFMNKKKINLKYPDARPMVIVQGRNNSEIFLPAELVCVNDLDAAVKQQLPMIASFKPAVRHDAIEEMKRYLTPGGQKTKGSGGGFLPALGIVLEDKRIKVDVEVLSLPLMKAAGITIPPEKGKMWAPIVNKADYNSRNGQVEMNVVVIYHETLERSYHSVYQQIRDLVNSFNSSYRFGNQPFAAVPAGDDRYHWQAVERYFDGQRLPSNIFVLDLAKPPRRQALDNAYSIVKHILTGGGFLSQFVNFNTYDHGNPRDQRKSRTILQGVSRQILSKCGVRVWWVNLPREIPMPVVFVGVDVFHAPRKYDPRLKKKSAKESVAAIVVQVIRSHEEADNENVEVYSETYRRDAGKEMELGGCMNQTVSNALRALNVNPMSCIIWRDGVGSNSVNTVAGQEIPAVRQALQAASTTAMISAPQSIPKNIPLSYMVVQKRISTKFLTTDGQGSLPCGSLIHGLKSSEHSTFYINGTSPPYSTPKPARFIVAEMDDGFGEQENANQVMADLSWALCHDYSNWTGPIKLPSPVQMAHKLAELAGGMPDCGDTINAEAFAGKIHFL